MTKKIIVFMLFIVLFFSSFIVYADAPKLLNFQGRLLDNEGKPLSGSYSMGFSIYNASAGGAVLWSETQQVQVQDGIYNTSLGVVSPLNLAFNEPYYLEVRIGAETLPRQPILASAYALNSERLGVLPASNFIYKNSNGSVGIGTATPQARLDVNGALALRMNAEDLNPCRISGFGNPHNYMDIQSGRGKDGTYRDIRIATGAWPNWNGEQLYLKGNGNVGVGTWVPTTKLDVNSDTLRLRTSKTPSRPTDTGNKGDICWDSNYIYVCVDTNTWKRSNLSGW